MCALLVSLKLGIQLPPKCKYLGRCLITLGARVWNLFETCNTSVYVSVLVKRISNNTINKVLKK